MIIFIINFDNFILFDKNQTGWTFTFASCFFEVELHADFIHDWDVFDDDSFVEFKVDSFNSSEDKELISFLFFHNQIFTADDSQEVFTRWYLHANNLIWLPSFSLQQTYRNLSDFLERFSIINVNLINLCDNKRVMFFKFDSDRAFKVLWNDRNSEIVFILSSVNVETSLINFVSDTIFHFGTKHHLVTSHEVKHNILKCWLERLRINQVKVNFVIGCNLNSFISFNKENKSSSIKHIILFPFFDILVFFIDNLFEKQNLTGTSGNQSSTVDQKHLS